METKPCPHCGLALPLEAFARSSKSKSGLQSWCRECTAERFAQHYAENREKCIARAIAHAKKTQEEDPRKHKAGRAARAALKRKEIVVGPCVVCGNERVELHHESYEPSQWLVVVPLCKRHHKERHAELDRIRAGVA